MIINIFISEIEFLSTQRDPPAFIHRPPDLHPRTPRHSSSGTLCLILSFFTYRADINASGSNYLRVMYTEPFTGSSSLFQKGTDPLPSLNLPLLVSNYRVNGCYNVNRFRAPLRPPSRGHASQNRGRRPSSRRSEIHTTALGPLSRRKGPPSAKTKAETRRFPGRAYAASLWNSTVILPDAGASLPFLHRAQPLSNLVSLSSVFVRVSPDPLLLQRRINVVKGLSIYYVTHRSDHSSEMTGLSLNPFPPLSLSFFSPPSCAPLLRS